MSSRRIEEPIVYVNNVYNIMVCLVAYYTILSVFTVSAVLKSSEKYISLSETAQVKNAIAKKTSARLP